jgi:hypothetical protein
VWPQRTIKCNDNNDNSNDDDNNNNDNNNNVNINNDNDNNNDTLLYLQVIVVRGHVVVSMCRTLKKWSTSASLILSRSIR